MEKSKRSNRYSPEMRARAVRMVLEGGVRQMRTSLRYPYPSLVSGGEEAAPLCESGGAGRLVGVAILEVALRRKVVVD